MLVGALVVAIAWMPPSATAHDANPDGVALANSVFASADPRATYDSLTPKQRAAFTRAETPTSDVLLAHVTSLPSANATVMASFSGTFWYSSQWGKQAAPGNTLYTWWQATKVWISSGRVTQVQVYNYGYETSTPGWRTDGISTQTYNAGWEGRGLVVAKMVLGAGGWDLQHTTNCGQVRLNADAVHYLISSSCNLN